MERCSRNTLIIIIIICLTDPKYTFSVSCFTVQEKAAQTAKSMAEQLKHYERKCQQSESHRTAMEERLQVYVEKEVQWKEDTEKLKVVSFIVCAGCGVWCQGGWARLWFGLFLFGV